MFEGATNGSVMFGDLNNDGWLDIEFSGYSDRASTGIKTYINKRDGSFEYYISEPIIENDPKSVGSFILAAIEYEKMTKK